MWYILSAIFLWSSLGIVIRLSGAPVHLLIFFSCLVSSCLIGLMFLKERYRRELPRGKGLSQLLIIGPISLANSFSFFYAYQNTTVANAVLTHYTAPVLVAFLAPIFLKERLTARVLSAVASATLGLWIMLDVSPPRFFSLLIEGDRATGGILAGLFSGFCYAVLVILFRVLSPAHHPHIMTFVQNLTIAAILLPFAATSPFSGSFLWAYAVMGVVHSTIAPVLYFRGFKEVTANRAAILGYLEPVCAILLGVLFLGEGVTYKTVLGGCIILFSGYLTVKDK
jgi:drug/metabolite transporter (DMT)-like permease